METQEKLGLYRAYDRIRKLINLELDEKNFYSSVNCFLFSFMPLTVLDGNFRRGTGSWTSVTRVQACMYGIFTKFYYVAYLPTYLAAWVP